MNGIYNVTETARKENVQMGFENANEPVCENKSEPKSESRIDKLLEKREMLKEKHSKSIENEKNTANRTKLLAEQIAKVDREIHAEEVIRMDKFCEERKFTYDGIIEYFKDFPPEATLDDIKTMTT